MTEPAILRPQADELIIERAFSARRPLIWRLLTDPVHLARWWGPEGMQSRVLAMEVRPGGPWRTVMENADGDRYEVGGVYTDVTPETRLAFTWAWRRDGVDGAVSEVSFTLADAGLGCHLRMRQTALPAGEEDSHQDGWTSAWRRLIAEAESDASSGAGADGVI